MNKITCAIFALGLTACGGGGGGGGTSAPAPSPTPTPDTTSPTISVTGGTSITLNQGDSFTNPSATVTDNRDTGLTADVSGTVDTSTPGTYTLTYSASDTSGNSQSITVEVIVNAVLTTSPINEGAVVFNFNNATTVLTTEDVAIQSGEKIVRQAKGVGSSNSTQKTLNEFIFIPSNNDSGSNDRTKMAKSIAGAKESALFNAGFSEREVIKLARDGASNFFVIDEEGNLEFAGESPYNFKVSYSVIDEDATFIYFAITDNDFYESTDFIRETGNCAIFKVKLSDGTWSCLADELVAINIDDSYRKTMSDDKRKPIQLDNSGNAYLIARKMNVNDNDGDGVSEQIDVDYSAEPVLYRISQDGTQRKISPDNVSIQNFIQVNDTTVVYTYQTGGNSGFEMITNLDQEAPSTVQLGDDAWWNDFFYALDDSNTVIFSTTNTNNAGISFVQPKENGGIDPYKLDTSAFSSSRWNTTPRRVILADDGGIYGLFEEQVNVNETSEVYANLKRILPYSAATFARFKLGSDWWNYFDNGNRNVQISKGYAFYLEDEESRSFGTRTVIKSVRLVDGDKQEFLNQKDESGTWTERYTVSNWKLSFDTLFFSAFDRSQSKMVQGELNVAAFRDGAPESEYLTITETASIVGNDNKIEDLEVLKASRPNVFTGSNPRIVQHYTNSENIYSASVEFNKYMDIDSVNDGISVTVTNDDDTITEVGALKVWLGRRLHLIFDTDITEESLTTDSLDFGSEYKISIDVEAKDLEDFALVSGLAPGSTQDFIEHSFTTRPEVGPFKGSDVIVDGITDGTILKYAAKSTNRAQAEAILADDIKLLNHRVEFSTPSSMYGSISLTITDPYQINWNGVTHSTSDSDGNVWDWFDGFEINAIGDDATLAAKWNGQVLDTFWGQTLDKKLVADITLDSDGNALVPIDDADWKTYKRIPYHQIDRDGKRYLQNYSGGIDTITALDAPGTPVYTNRQGHYYDTETELEYYEYFGDWIANYGTDEAIVLTNFDSENIVWKDWGWYDTEGNRFDVNLDGVSDKWVNVNDADDVIDNLYFSFRVDGFPYSDKNSDGFVDISTFAIISGSDTGLFGENMSAEVQGEAAYTWQSDWTGEPTFTADNFEATLDDWRKFLETNFGGWGNDNGRGSQFELTSQKVGEDYFNFDWENNFNMDLNASDAWVKHVIELTTNIDNEVTMTYQIIDAEGNVINNGSDDAEETREIFTDINEASWQYLIDDTEKGGFKLNLRILNGDIAIDNLKVVDISDPANEVVILESTFDQGNEGVFQSN